MLRPLRPLRSVRADDNVLLSGSEMSTGVLHTFFAGSYILCTKAGDEKIQTDMYFIESIRLQIGARIWLHAVRLGVMPSDWA